MRATTDATRRRALRTDRSATGRDEQGIVAVEFALVLPLLVLIVMSAVTFGQALHARYMLVAAADETARACVLDQATGAACQQHARARLARLSGYCGQLAVNLSTDQLAGLQHTDALRVEVTCPFVGGVATGFLRRFHIAITQLHAVATMPY